MFLIPKSMF